MVGYIRWIDSLSKALAHSFGWCIVMLTLGTSYEVFMRYVLNRPTSWAYDMSYMFYGALFMMAGAYTLSKNAHVRGDFLYQKWKPTTQAKVDLVLYIIFFFPGVTALFLTGGNYALESARILEVSVNSPAGVPVWPLKAIIFAAGLSLLLAGSAEVCRCLYCIKHGEWLSRDEDIKELEQVLLETHGTDKKVQS
ncbi:MAG: TRAP transporter small permease subunit [Burkholderiaceae bacterium]|mgnify:CR=1 FL=1|jgi:TRAP-type mannitol/chloroaromatic compound transport system permease small subunit|nr:TRAP transporter small permease subunit [Burkholderiaceae bacterium]